MVHHPDSDVTPSLRQVEFNTISSSFGPLSERSAALHRYLYASTKYYDAAPCLKPENFPPNETTSGLVKGLAAAHSAYSVPGSRILFVVQAGERNVFDQRWLEYELLEKHSIHVIRRTFEDLALCAKVQPQTRALLIEISSPSKSITYEISTVYFRAGYTPTDYPTPAHFDTRYLLESSRAINCPSIPLQLAGGKKVQEALTKPGVLERFLLNTPSTHSFDQEDLIAIRATWMEMWALDEGGDKGITKAREHAMNLVLKPQREGGGNNVYKEAIPPFLDALSSEERAAWIAMRLISTPKGLGNYLVRAGGGADSAVKTEVISELGIFGWALFGGSEGVVIEEENAGWLVRTKGKDSNEGGVAAGFSVLDSVVLID